MSNTFPPIRPITTSPLHHWFGYYDKCQIDPTNRYALSMGVGFEHRSPRGKDAIKLGLIDMEGNDTWTEFATTQAWCWQQGCMLQWVPNSNTDIIWNDREDDHFISKIYNTKTGQTRTLPKAVYTLSPNGKTAIGTDFRRINHMRPGYGYAGITDPNHNISAPEDAGIYTLNLETGESELIVTIAEVAKISYPHGDISEARHYFNHLLFNTDGSRFIFLHRWRFGEGTFHTRMLTANANGSNLHVVDDYGKMSHFIWRDPHTILGWAYHPSQNNKFYLYEDQTQNTPQPIGPDTMTVNGHCTYLPGNKWILNDTYPSKDSRNQILYLYHVDSGKRIDLGIFPSPEPYTGEWRCDLHPRFSPNGQFITIDSAHAGNGRQIYRIDIGDII
ncbi:MAG: hypothetical protein HOE48_16620 [Candidatus Latescibacteria bacterium]|jgi:hypothetical protein|nr:hypothetical protein [Candidatus Latescibacterota bacterium]MBT5829820.1 hypothetical protein [Candidatus Latescibacterota bacterium]